MTIAKNKRSTKNRYFIPYDRKEDIINKKQQVAANSLHNALVELKLTIGNYKVLVATANRNMRLDESHIREISSLAQEIHEINKKLKEVKQ